MHANDGEVPHWCESQIEREIDCTHSQQQSDRDSHAPQRREQTGFRHVERNRRQSPNQSDGIKQKRKLRIQKSYRAKYSSYGKEKIWALKAVNCDPGYQDNMAQQERDLVLR